MHGLRVAWRARSELHDLLAKPSLAGIPLLVLGNKNDLPDALGTPELIERLDLKARARAGGDSTKAPLKQRVQAAVRLVRTGGTRHLELGWPSTACLAVSGDATAGGCSEGIRLSFFERTVVAASVRPHQLTEE
jgi:hypothetical protein